MFHKKNVNLDDKILKFYENVKSYVLHVNIILSQIYFLYCHWDEISLPEITLVWQLKRCQKIVVIIRDIIFFQLYKKILGIYLYPVSFPPYVSSVNFSSHGTVTKSSYHFNDVLENRSISTINFQVIVGYGNNHKGTVYIFL